MGKYKSKSRKKPQSKSGKRTSSFNTGTKVLVIIIMAGIVLAAIFYFSNSFQGPTGENSLVGGNYKVGKPGPGIEAPNIQLPSTDGSTFDLTSLRGQTVLLYFQEGVMCQPCWDQLKEIETSIDQFKALGIDEIKTITTDPLKALKQKVELEQLTTQVLSDQSLVVSETYTTNLYGMMGNKYNGHSFIVVGSDGIIKWRADYGGSPGYTMYIPVSNLIADMSKGLNEEGMNSQ